MVRRDATNTSGYMFDIKEANVTIECNPLLGPVFFETAQKLANGETVEKWIKSEEGIFRQETAAEDIKTRVY